MDKLEKRFGKYAIPRLTLVLLVCNAAGYLLRAIGMGNLLVYLQLDPYQILHGQVWRLVTWVMIPSVDLFSFLIVSALFYYPIGSQMERVWGDFKYNLYLFMGLVFTVIGAFLLYAYYAAQISGGMQFFVQQSSGPVAFGMREISAAMGYAFTPYYVMLSIFFAFAATFPESMVMFMFLIPLKIKWLGLAYGAYMVYQIYAGSMIERVIIIVSLLNFVIFYLWSRQGTFQRYKPSEVKRRRDFQQSTRMRPAASGTHRCSVCGATDQDHPEYEFRYCSKCNGAYEYCQEHLFTHTHR